MANQTSYNNKATSNVVLFRNFIQNSISDGDCCFTVVDTVDQLSLIQNPEVDHIAIIWNSANASESNVPSIAIYLGSGNWMIKALKGERGSKGDPGRDGEDGEDGEKGEKGEKGDPGSDGFTPNHRWSGTQLQFQKVDGSWGVLVDLKGEKGAKGDPGSSGSKGDKPAHEWSGTSLRFENPNSTWGLYVDLKGPKGDPGNAGNDGNDGQDGRPPKHQIDSANFRLRFENPDGSWGNWIVYGSSMVNSAGITELNILDSAGNTLSIDKLVDTSMSFVLPQKNLLHVTIVTPEGESNPTEPYPGYSRVPIMVEKWWYKKGGEQLMGEGGTPTTEAEYFCYYTNHNTMGNVTPMSMLPSTMPITDAGVFYKGMKYLETGSNESNRKNLKDYMIATERVAIRSLLEGIKLKFSWGHQGPVDTVALQEIADDHLIPQGYKQTVAGSYVVTYDDIPYGIMMCRNLKIDIPNYHKIAGKTPVLLIDRYKKRKVRGSFSDGDLVHASSGFKHASSKFTDDNEESPMYRIPITSARMVLNEANFNVHKMFSCYDRHGEIDESPNADFIFHTRGAGRNNANITSNGAGSSMAHIRLRFRIQWCNVDNRGRKKIFKTADSGQLGVQVIRLRDKDVEDSEQFGDISAKAVVGGGDGEPTDMPNSVVPKTHLRLITYKII